MCDRHHAPQPPRGRQGIRLADGRAHADDHVAWTRRDFMMGMAALGAGSMLVGGTPVRAFGSTPLLRALQDAGTDRTLVLVQLAGGNDGLNTVIPYRNDLYFNQRPGLAIRNAMPLDAGADVALHPSLEQLRPLYGDGYMSVLQNVGYANPDRSHFRSTDIWASASDADDVVTTGWAGRYLDALYPGFVDDPTDFPLAVQLGGGASALFQGPSASMSMNVASTDIFERLVEQGILYRTDDVPSTTYGSEMSFVRTVANSSFRYAGAIQDAADGVQNSVQYPGGNPLARDLAVLARLIKGSLGARIYLVTLGGFDTHANQANTHATLLRYVAEGVSAFLSDLGATGHADDVLVMTFSEFGRRIRQNAQNGTDHGTAAPLFLFGPGVQGGLFGDAPDLEDVDRTGDLKYDLDFRSVYATVLQDWMGLSAATVDGILGGSFDRLEVIADPLATSAEFEAVPESFTLGQNYPNPFNPRTLVPYALDQTGHVSLRVYDVQGRLVDTLVDETRPAGHHTAEFEAGHLPSGTYFYRLETPHGREARQMVLVK